MHSGWNADGEVSGRTRRHGHRGKLEKQSVDEGKNKRERHDSKGREAR